MDKRNYNLRSIPTSVTTTDSSFPSGLNPQGTSVDVPPSPDKNLPPQNNAENSNLESKLDTDKIRSQNTQFLININDYIDSRLNVSAVSALDDSRAYRMVKHLPACDGLSREMILQFLEEMDDVLIGAHYSFDLVKYHVRDIVKGEFRSWWAQNSGNFANWESLKTALIARFLRPADIWFLTKTYVDRPQRNDERCASYVNGIAKKHKALQLRDSESELVKKIFENTNFFSICQLGARYPRDLEELLQRALHADDNLAHKEKRFELENTSPSDSGKGRHNYFRRYGNSRGNNSTCHYCGNTGHWANACPSRQGSSNSTKRTGKDSFVPSRAHSWSQGAGQKGTANKNRVSMLQAVEGRVQEENDDVVP